MRIRNAPTVVRHCKKCGAKQPFRSSGAFRVNAQRKILDIWLIYKCAKCDTTWNLSILSRVHPQSIPPETLRGFLGNHPELALRYAMDSGWIRRNGGEPGLPEIEVWGEPIDISEPTRLRIVPQYPLTIPAATILRSKMGLSRSALDRLCADGTIRSALDEDLRRCKLSGEIIVEIG